MALQMSLEKNLHYIYRIGSDNQYRLHWNGTKWHYEFLAGGVLFDDQKFSTESELLEALSMHGMNLEQFSIDQTLAGESYSNQIQNKIKKLQELGIKPCAKHGLISKNSDNTCEACENTDYPDDFKGTEG